MRTYFFLKILNRNFNKIISRDELYLRLIEIKILLFEHKLFQNYQILEIQIKNTFDHYFFDILIKLFYINN
jgi:hypothetical protein